jgi:hypothetical protein
MEDELRDIESGSLQQSHIQTILSELQTTIDEAQSIRDKELVQDAELRKALTVVESFLRKTHRICYGGMAINAHLPKSKQFYDFQKTLPDYDFFTPSPEEDVKLLTETLQRAGFTEVSARLGMHEGTTKIFVNYTGVADISFCPHWLYSTLSKRAIQDDGISYADADFLRMNMYLELSRPRGEVERWDKVYKRLVLLNMVKAPHVDACEHTHGAQTRISKPLHKHLIHYLSENNLTYCGSLLERIYSKPTTKQASYLLHSTTPVLAFAENPYYHIPIIRQMIHTYEPHAQLKIVHLHPQGDILPELYGIQKDGRLICAFVQAHACHSYNTVSISSKETLRIASLDTAIALMYALSYTKGLHGLVPKSFHCVADSLVSISMRTRDKNHSGVFPLFVQSCQGHQPTKASLLRQKAQRIQSLKQKQKTRRVQTGKRTTKKRPRNGSR